MNRKGSVVNEEKSHSSLLVSMSACGIYKTIICDLLLLIKWESRHILIESLVETPINQILSYSGVWRKQFQ